MQDRKKIDHEQTLIETKKFESHSYNEPISRNIQLPDRYNKDRIVALIRDPWWIFAYWEITQEKENEVKNKIKSENKIFSCTILRVHNITNVRNFNGYNSNSYFDIKLNNMERSWYINVNLPENTWCVDIGMLTKDKSFFLLIRSNIVTTPRFGISDKTDSQWACSQERYWEMASISTGMSFNSSSLEFKRKFEKSFGEWIVSSFK